MKVKVDEQLIDRLSELAKLEFNSGEKQDIIKDLNNILHFVDKLREMDTKGVEPLIYVSGQNKNILRKDLVKSETTKEEALKNAPLKDSDYIKVPKVLQK